MNSVVIEPDFDKSKYGFDLTTFIFLLIILIIVIFVLWLFFGGKKHDFVGLTNYEDEFEDESEEEDEFLNSICPTPNHHYSPSQTPSQSRYNQITPIPDETPQVTSRFTDQNYPNSKNSPLFTQSGFVNLKYKKKNRKYKKMDERSGAESRGEAICRKVLEDIYKVEFPKARPDFLINPQTGYNLELDGYNCDLQIAFEYQGIQHYVYPNIYHKSLEEFNYQRQKDDFKFEVCDKAGIYLITVPYLVPHNQIYNYIVERLPENIINNTR